MTLEHRVLVTGYYCAQNINIWTQINIVYVIYALPIAYWIYLHFMKHVILAWTILVATNDKSLDSTISTINKHSEHLNFPEVLKIVQRVFCELMLWKLYWILFRYFVSRYWSHYCWSLTENLPMRRRSNFWLPTNWHIFFVLHNLLSAPATSSFGVCLRCGAGPSSGERLYFHPIVELCRTVTHWTSRLPPIFHFQLPTI